MKKIFILVSIFFSASVFAQNKKATLKIEGDIKHIKDTVDWVYVTYAASGKRITDSSKVENKKYGFALNISEPTQASFRISKSGINKRTTTRKDYATVFLQGGKIKISSVDSFANVKVKGSKANVEFVKLNHQLKPYNEQLEKLYVQYTEYRKAKNTIEQKAVEAKIDSLEEKMNSDVYGNYVKTNAGSPLALYALQRFAGYDIDAAKVEPLFNQLAPAVQSSESGLAFQTKIETAKKLGVGKNAIEFTQNDTLGNPISLSSFKGKYVLLDFWASWCGPCRAENPNVVKAFSQYKDKGFTILSVSLDQPGAKDKWLKAIHDDNLTWTHVSDLQFWNNAVAKLYGIQAIPASFLLDPQGKIIGKNLRGEELVKKLKEVL